ncbi:ABC transporter permease subunit [Pseudodesulfovibrio cashew]|uniref:ABC transporter permease subunit n=1 Tax=Pseudodesulfovibrio cashew TaxID=2678688 RepID=A0A6I6JRP9_9BACT|nr:amino acid ABC transporter permease [Pseudodesulfovibrio cashew]QGY40284.1 ABC transporter permease subunit [Pseudodesulfovibrio cashew]
MIEFSLWDIIRHLLVGGAWTVALSLIAFISGGIVGLMVLIARISPRPLFARLAKAYIEFFQDTPLLMQLFLIFFGIGLLGVDISPLLTAALGLTLFTSAYLAEIWRGCVESIAHGQWEAGESLALSRWQQMRFVILPQAVRIAIPPTVGFSVQVVKGTAVTSIIGFMEITKTGSMISNATFRPLLVYGLVAVGYFIICFPLSALARQIERRLHAACSR